MKNIKPHLVDVEQINVQRIIWLIASIVIYSIILVVAISLSFYNKTPVSAELWIVGLGIIGIWWVWTMHIIKTLIAHRRIEFYILQDIILDLQETKKLTKELFDHSSE